MQLSKDLVQTKVVLPQFNGVLGKQLGVELLVQVLVVVGLNLVSALVHLVEFYKVKILQLQQIKQDKV